VGLARGLAVDPEVLLMDEPFSALDPLIRREMRDELLQIQKRFGTTIVFITHDLHEALELGHHIAIMKDGRFVQVGGPEEIVTAPADDYVAAFTSDVDRTRVLTAASVVSPVEPLVAGRDTVATARARGAATLPVVNGAGAPIGFARAGDLAACAPDAPIETAMCTDFPVAPAATRLDALLGRSAGGLPIAVTGEAGRLIGVIRPRDVLAGLATGAERKDAATDG
jgi:glycine betaine/proline transport system ATP-binding protein